MPIKLAVYVVSLMGMGDNQASSDDRPSMLDSLSTSDKMKEDWENNRYMSADDFDNDYYLTDGKGSK